MALLEPGICVFEVGNFLLFQADSYEKRNPSDSVAFLGVISEEAGIGTEMGILDVED